MSVIPADLARTTSPWRRACAVAALLLAAVLLTYRDTLMTMVGVWSRSDTFAHAFLVPPISIWLVWRMRDRLALLTPTPQPWVLIPLLLIGALWLAGEMLVANAVAQFALVAMIVLVVPAVMGLQVTRVMSFPLAFMFFSVPAGEFLMPTLMEWTADFTVMALQLSGVPVYREGLQFVIPTGNWSVVEGCSGLRYLIASFMVGTLFAYLNYRSNRRRWIFVGVSLLVPLLANWVRAYMIVMLGHLSNNKIAVGVDHLIYGWVFFGAVILLMFWIGAKWAEAPAPAAAHSQQPPVPEFSSPAGTLAGWSLALVGLATLVAPQAALWAMDRHAGSSSVPVVVLPDTLTGSWTRADQPDLALKPRFLDPSAETERSYRSDAGSVGVYLAYYRGQTRGRKLVNSENVIVVSTSIEWNQVGSGSTTVALPDGELLIKTTTLKALPSLRAHSNTGLTVWQLYWVDDRWTASDLWARAYTAKARLQGRGDDGAALVLYTADNDGARGKATLEAFVRANLPALRASLQATRQAR